MKRPPIVRGQGMDSFGPTGGEKGGGSAPGTWKDFVHRHCAEFPINCIVGKD